MKIAVIADPHANFLALQAIVNHVDSWQPDYVVVLGDIVNRGPRPMQCLNLVQEKQDKSGWLLVRGNHEDYVISQSKPGTPRSGPVAEVHRASYWTYQQLDCDIAYLNALPFQQDVVGPEGEIIRFVHASMRGNRVGIYPDISDNSLREKITIDGYTGSPPSVFCVGHTHRALIRRLNNILIVNAGSAGLPFDSNPRPSYAQLTYHRSNWDAEIIRLRYDITLAEQEFYNSGYLEIGGPLVRLVQIELRTATSQLFHWAARFQKRALLGEITMEDAVNQYLSNQFAV